MKLCLDIYAFYFNVSNLYTWVLINKAFIDLYKNNEIKSNNF